MCFSPTAFYHPRRGQVGRFAGTGIRWDGAYLGRGTFSWLACRPDGSRRGAAVNCRAKLILCGTAARGANSFLQPRTVCIRGFALEAANHRKRGAVTRLAGHLDLAAVVGDDAPGFTEPQTQTTAGLPGRIEGIENMVCLVRLDAWPIVADANFHVGIAAVEMRSRCGRRCRGPLRHFDIAPARRRPVATESALMPIGPGSPRAANRRFLPQRAGRSSATEVIDQPDQFHRLSSGRRGPGKQHHVGDHLVDAHRLGTNQGQGVLTLGVLLLAQQKLGAARDDGQRVIDFVAGPGGKLGQCGQFLGLQPRAGSGPRVPQVGRASTMDGGSSISGAIMIACEGFADCRSAVDRPALHTPIGR